MAAVPCSKCTAERKGFRRELDSWRYRLIHCVGFESILEGIYGSMLTRDLNLFDDCEPEEVVDWSPEANCSHCSFCNLPLDKLGDLAPSTTSPLSSPSDFSPCQAPTISESSQTAHKFLQAVFHKKDVPPCCDANIPRIAEELMKKMIHQFAMEYASKCLLHTTSMDVTTRTSSPLSGTPDAPLDLTLNRTPGETERESDTADGVLDLSKKNSGATSTHSSTLSSNVKASGCPSTSDKEELGDLKQRKPHQQSALGVVLSSLCLAHCSLLCQMLKLAHKENVLLTPAHKPIPTETHCCHCGLHTPDVVPKCKSRNSDTLDPDCSLQGCRSTPGHPRDLHLKGCKSVAPSDPNSCCKVNNYALICPKRLQCTSSHGLPANNINDLMCSIGPCASVHCKPHPCLCVTNHTRVTHHKKTTGECEPPPPVLRREPSPSPPPLSPIFSDIDITDDPPPSLLHHQQEEEAAHVVHDHPGQHIVGVVAKTPELESWTPRNSHAENNTSGTLLQDVVNRFSEKLDTIRPPEKDPALPSSQIDVPEQEQLQSTSTSQNLKFPADALLTEIITTVLHTRSASDYNISELFHRHDDKEPKLPNTRLRRRQEVLAAMATPADGATNRRQSLQIKRELAMLDVPNNRKKSPQAKGSQLKDGNAAVNTCSALLDSNVMPEEENETELNMDYQSVTGVPLNIITRNVNEVKDDETERQRKRGISMHEKDPNQTMSHELQRQFCNHCSQDGHEQSQVKTPCDQHCQKDKVSAMYDPMILENAPSVQSCGTDECDNGPVDYQSHTAITDDHPVEKSPSNESRRSRRNIVPPQRFSSYVTETRKAFFAACFSENIFNQRTNNVFTAATSDALFKKLDVKDAQLESKTETSNLPDTFASISREENSPSLTESKEQSPDVPQALAVKEIGCADKPSENAQPHPKSLSVSNTASKTFQYENIRVTTRSATCAKNSCISPVQYTSPIKLMFVSPLNDKEGLVYSLKSARSSSNAQTDEPFDPCKESSWAGTPEKKQSQMTEGAMTHIRLNRKSTTSPLKYAGPSTKSCPPAKQPLSPARSPSPPTLRPSPFKLYSLSPESASSPSAPLESSSSPAKSLSSSPQSSGKCTSSPTSSSPKTGSKRSGDVTPPKNQFGTVSRPPGELQSLDEISPVKRRPGRPKKLGPHLEKKAKRPIGRPRKQKSDHAATGKSAANIPTETEEKINKNLKITVVYGRSRKNKRIVSESFDQLQTEFRDACRAVGLKNDLSGTQNSQIIIDNPKRSSPEFPEVLHCANPVKEAAQHLGGIKCPKTEKALPSRKPGRPAKVKISGISVTVTTVSPKQRKILIAKDSPDKQRSKKALLPEFQSTKEAKTVSCPSVSDNFQFQPEEQRESESKNSNQVLNQPSAVRHSKRVSKPSIYFLHAVATATTRTYSHSNALLRRSKQLLLNKACNKRKQEKQNPPVNRHCCDQKRKNISHDLARVAGVSLDSIFAPKATLRWWAASAQQQPLNRELARRIQLMSDTWVSDPVENHNVEGTGSSVAKSKHSSLVQTLFNCPPTKPGSCSMQQLGSWFIETTETQSLDIVKKTSSCNRYEVMHFPRSSHKQGVKCQSPRAERLSRHLKKFAKTLPKSPVQYEKAKKRLRKIQLAQSIGNIRQRLLAHKSVKRILSQGTRKWRCLSKYQATLLQVKRHFLTQKERTRAKKERNTQVTARGPKLEALKSVQDEFPEGSGNNSKARSEEPVAAPEEPQTWSPETLKECRVCLKKINTPDNKSAEEWDSYTVTLDKSASAFVFAGKDRQLLEVVQAVKRKRHTNGIAAATKLTDSACKSLQKLDGTPLGRQKDKCEFSQPPPAKKLRQSRMKGLSGPKWCDFVLGR
ncbi:uncharacterized protein lcorl isoform X1 [Vanacampus margaritifer]